MPDISVSEDQHERLHEIQERLAADVEYGHVRPRDALEYLLDHVDGGAVRTGSEPTETAVGTAVTESTAVHMTDGINDGDGDTDDDGSSADGETRLNSVMSLLEDNDGVWREAGGGEEKYVVDLPDGSTERARTKDDVRAVLFKHYR